MADTKDRTKQKACLERYRKAWIGIVGVLKKAAPQATASPSPLSVHREPQHACCRRDWQVLENLGLVTATRIESASTGHS